MYHGDSSPRDQAADAAMAALYQQLDDHDLDADTPFSIAAGHRDLIYRIQAGLSRGAQSAHASHEHEGLLIAACGTVGHHSGNLIDLAGRRRLNPESSPTEEASSHSGEDEGIVHCELVDDLLPCHHGCTCGLHQQVVHGGKNHRPPPGLAATDDVAPAGPLETSQNLPRITGPAHPGGWFSANPFAFVCFAAIELAFVFGLLVLTRLSPAQVLQITAGATAISTGGFLGRNAIVTIGRRLVEPNGALSRAGRRTEAAPGQDRPDRREGHHSHGSVSGV